MHLCLPISAVKDTLSTWNCTKGNSTARSVRPSSLMVNGIYHLHYNLLQLHEFLSNIAKNLHKNVNQISTPRAQLISKGIIFPIRYKELDFTVPEFSGYIQRLDEYKQWLEENGD